MFPFSCLDGHGAESSTVLRGIVNLANQIRRTLRRVLEQIVRNTFEVSGGFFCPAKQHLGGGLLACDPLFEAFADRFMR